MMNDNPCRVDQFGVICEEHNQSLLECALLLQQVRQLQIRILNQWRESHGDCDDLMKTSRETVEQARLRLEALTVARDILVAVNEAEKEARIPDVAKVIGGGDEARDDLISELQDQLDRAVTHAFSNSFLVAALLGLAALVPILISRRDVSV